MDIRTAITDRILILDGAMGSMLQRLGSDDVDSERLCLTHPEMIRSVHEAYIAAGADIIETDSFGANPIAQAEYGLAGRAEELAFSAAYIARQAADAAGRKVFVAGSIGPTGKSLTLSSDSENPTLREVDFDAMCASYKTQIKGLKEGGVDFILLETCFDALNAKAALAALGEVDPELPVMISVTVSDRSGRTLTGQTMEAFYRSVRHCPSLIAFGINCALGASQMAPLVREIAAFSDLPVLFYPNAGLPDALGQYSDTPDEMASVISSLASEGVINIAGGCCGTGPEHIAAIAAALDGISPRPAKEADTGLYVSGLESFCLERSMNFTNIGERTNVTGSRRFARLVGEKKYDEALEVAAAQIDGGAVVIDVNMDDPLLDSPTEMRTFLRLASNDPAVAKAAVMIDSSHWETILEGLKNTPGRCIVNSISLKDGEEEFVRKAAIIHSLGAAMVVMAFDEEGQAESLERKIAICRRSYGLLTGRAGVPPQDIIFDPNIFAIGTGIPEHSRFGTDYIEAVRWIKSNLPLAKTSGGVSNVSFAFRGQNTLREAMHAVFLYHAIKAGLDMAIVNPQMLRVYDTIGEELRGRIEDVIFDSSPDATQRLVDYAADMASREREVPAGSVGDGSTRSRNGKGPTKWEGLAVPDPPCGNPTSEDRLSGILITGRTENLEETVLSCHDELGSAVKVIEGPLMKGMERVGELFSEGRLFLPQVVKSARIMKDAVSVLEPFLASEKTESNTSSIKPKYLIATVQGDIHDIGKNITSIVLRCSGFEVIDMGVMVPSEVLLDKAAEENVDIIGVCGLITPSLNRMEEICRGMEARGMKQPLFVGGAATTDLHTALRLRPIHHDVFHSPDASSAAVMARKFLKSPDIFRNAEDARYSRIIDASEKKKSLNKNVIPEHCPCCSHLEEGFLKENIFEDLTFPRLSADELLPYFDWSLFHTICGEKDGFRDKGQKDEAMEKMKLERPEAFCQVRFFDCTRTDGDTITSDCFSLPMFRGEGNCLADYIPGDGKTSQMGLFAIKVDNSTDPEDLISHAVRSTLAEAASKYIEAILKERLPEGLKIIMPGIGYPCCPDHSLKRDILNILPGTGITLTDSAAMIPEASICGLVLAHRKASYRSTGKADASYIKAYAEKRGMNEEEKTLFLGHLMMI